MAYKSSESDCIANFKTNKKKCHKPTRRPITQNFKKGTNVYTCELCNETFQQPNLLRSHKQLMHNTFKPFRCENCSEQYNMQKNLLIHAAGHIEAPTSCPECGISFQRSAGYRGHLKTHMINDNFSCKKCEKDFEFEIYYRHHIENNHTQLEHNDDSDDSSTKQKKGGSASSYKPYSCDICGNKYTKVSNLNRHRLTHSEVKPYRCDVCFKEFTQKSSLQRHCLLHSDRKPFKCSKCSMSFSQRGNLRTHTRRVHPRNPDLTNKFPCPNCSCVFNKLNSLNRHSAKEHSRKPLTGNDDNDEDPEYSFDKVMAQLKDLQSNMNRSTDNISLFPIETFKTPTAESVPELKDGKEKSSSYIKIVETLNAENEKSQVLVKQIEENDRKKYYSCNLCSKCFRRPHDLLRHNRVHTKEKPYECGICGRCFAIKNNLQVHLRIHGKDNGRITNCFQCPECLTQFSSMRQLDVHVQTHEGLKLFACEICGKHFRNSNNLRVHKYTHRYRSKIVKELLSQLEVAANEDELPSAVDKADGNRQFQCSICGLKFKRFSHLSQHEKGHSGLKPYQCLTCKKQFTVLSSLNTHQKIHSDHKTKQCDECGLKFRSNTQLKRHKTKHSTARPYKCPYCKKSFKTKVTCMTHISTHLAHLTGSTKNNVDDKTNMTNHSCVPTQNSSIQTTILNESSLISEHSVCLAEANSMYQDENVTETQPSLDTIDKNCEMETGYTSKFIQIEELHNRELSKALADTITVESINKPSVSWNSEERTSSPIDTSLQVNTTNGKYVCESCGRSFKKPIDLRRHIRTHTEERPFKCNICDAAFKLKCTLVSHMQVHDKNRAKCDCQVCGKSYASQDVLKIHLRIHTNERPYKCTLCTKTFRTTGHRDAHIRTHTKSMKKLIDVKGNTKKKVHKLNAFSFSQSNASDFGKNSNINHN